MSQLSERLDRYSLYIALLAAWIALLGSLYFSEVKGFLPCDLCWIQRILMYPLSVILTVGLLRRDENLPLLVLPLSTLGVFVALYHYLLEKTNLFPAHLCRSGVSCTTTWINWFGFATIPFLSLLGFTVITLMCVIAWQASEPVTDPDEGAPWLLVSSIVAVILVAFAILYTIGGQAVEQTQLLAPPSGQTTLDAEQLYLQGCASCHGSQGEGVAGLGVALANTAFVKQNSDSDLLALIRAGRGLDDPKNSSKLVMPPSGGRPDLTDEQLLAIIQLIRNF